MNDFNYSTVLTRCMLLSALALGLGVAFPALPPVVAFTGALVPLIWYHTMFLRPKAADGLPQPAIDSVYYYGFLITIGALGATALDLSLRGLGEDFAPVAFQFGLGLLATGYAVWARVHLTASTKILDEEELRSIMSRQIAQSRELLANVELASSSFESYAATLLQRSEQFAVDAEARSRTSIDAAIKAFSDGIAAMSEQAQIALADLRGVVNDVTFGSEREALRNSVSAMVETVTELSQSLDKLRASAGAGAGSVGEFAGSLERVNTSAAAVGGRLEPLGREDGPVALFDQALGAGGERAREFVTAAAGATTAMSGFGEAGLAGRQAMEAVGRKATLTATKLENLGGALDAVAASGEGLEETTAKLVGLREAAEAGSGGLRALEAQLATLQTTAGDIDATLGEATDQLRNSIAAGAIAIGSSSDGLRDLEAQLASLRKTASGLDAALGGAADPLRAAIAAGAESIDAAAEWFSNSIDEARTRTRDGMTSVAAPSETIDAPAAV